MNPDMSNRSLLLDPLLSGQLVKLIYTIDDKYKNEQV